MLQNFIVQVIFYFLWDHRADSGYSENRIPLKPALGCVCSLANYSVTYKETNSNRVSDFRDYVCSLFPKAILFYFYFILLQLMLCRVAAVKSRQCRLYFISFGIIEPILVSLKNEYRSSRR